MVGHTRPGHSPGRSWLVIGAASLIGLGGYLYPFLLPAVSPAGDRSAHAADAPLLLALVTLLCLVAIVTELSADPVGGSAKTVALLGVLVAIDATLRLAPAVLGASPVFPLIVLTGAVFGAALGFQMGALTILVSAFLTGGIGPWLPYQMLGAGWIGLSAGWLPRLSNPRARIGMLAFFGACWGLLYGALLNLWFWPFAGAGSEGAAGLYWSPDLGFVETIAAYSRFYLTTSLVYDLFRAAGNAALLLLLGGPLLRALERYRSRFQWQVWEPEEAPRIVTAPPSRTSHG
ncbi:MAG: ECF transporter S component [Chloroflexota bacterium]|nr:ECF transporter S component [Chloroflexota bacterium]